MNDNIAYMIEEALEELITDVLKENPEMTGEEASEVVYTIKEDAMSIFADRL